MQSKLTCFLCIITLAGIANEIRSASPTTAPTQDQYIPAYQPEPVIHNTNYNYTTTHIEIDQEIINSMANTIHTYISHIYSGMHDRISQYNNALLERIDTITTILQAHPWYTAGTSFLTGCLLLNSYLCYITWHLHKTTNWSYWKYHIPNEQLEMMSYETLGQELMRDIHLQYLSRDQPTDFAHVAIAFSQALEQEMQLLKRYYWICTVLSWCLLLRFSYCDYSIYKYIDTRLQRLHILWHVFSTWMAHYNIVNTS